MTVLSPPKQGRDLIAPNTFDKLCAQITRDHHLERDMAERIADQAAAYLAACASTPEPLAPSLAVDIGWHALILRTRDYAEICQQVAGHFIHHVPNDDPAAEEDVQAVLDRTAEAIRSAGYAVDEELWRVGGAVKCSQCNNGCADDPPPIPPFTGR